MKVYNPKTKEDWLSLRAQDVTATEAAALFGVNPYTTEYQLWQEKKSGNINSIDETERMTWGKRLEQVIAEGICEDNGWEILDLFAHGSYFRHSHAQMGATPDFFVMCPERGIGILEIKNIDWLQHKLKWEDDEAPAHIEIQLQQQMHVTQDAGVKWGAVGYLKGGNEAGVFIREYDAEMCDTIQDNIAMFWQSIEENKQPPADYDRDADYLIKQHGFDNGTEADMQDNERLESLAAQYKALSTQATEISKTVKGLKAQILEEVGEHTTAYTAGWKISAKRSKDSVGTLITEDMVGTYIGARKGSRRLTLKATME